MSRSSKGLERGAEMYARKRPANAPLSEDDRREIKLFKHSPVATMEYIKSQMQDVGKERDQVSFNYFNTHKDSQAPNGKIKLEICKTSDKLHRRFSMPSTNEPCRDFNSNKTLAPMLITRLGNGINVDTDTPNKHSLTERQPPLQNPPIGISGDTLVKRHVEKSSFNNPEPRTNKVLAPMPITRFEDAIIVATDTSNKPQQTERQPSLQNHPNDFSRDTLYKRYVYKSSFKSPQPRTHRCLLMVPRGGYRPNDCSQHDIDGDTTEFSISPVQIPCLRITKGIVPLSLSTNARGTRDILSGVQTSSGCPKPPCQLNQTRPTPKVENIQYGQPRSSDNSRGTTGHRATGHGATLENKSEQRIQKLANNTIKEGSGEKLAILQGDPQNRLNNLNVETWSAVSTISPASELPGSSDRKTKCALTSTPQRNGENFGSNFRATCHGPMDKSISKNESSSVQNERVRRTFENKLANSSEHLLISVKTPSTGIAQRCLQFSEGRVGSMLRRPPIAPKTIIASEPNVSKARGTRQGEHWLRPINLFPDFVVKSRDRNDDKDGGEAGKVEEIIILEDPLRAPVISSVKNMSKFRNAHQLTRKPNVSNTSSRDSQSKVRLPFNIVRSDIDTPLLSSPTDNTRLGERARNSVKPDFDSKTGTHSSITGSESRMMASSAVIKSIYCGQSSRLPLRKPNKGKSAQAMKSKWWEVTSEIKSSGPPVVKENKENCLTQSDTIISVNDRHPRNSPLISQAQTYSPDKTRSSKNKPDASQRIEPHNQMKSQYPLISNPSHNETAINDLNKGTKEQCLLKSAEKNIRYSSQMEEQFIPGHLFIQKISHLDASYHLQNNLPSRNARQSFGGSYNEKTTSAQVPRRQSLPPYRAINHDEQIGGSVKPIRNQTPRIRERTKLWPITQVKPKVKNTRVSKSNRENIRDTIKNCNAGSDICEQNEHNRRGRVLLKPQHRQIRNPEEAPLFSPEVKPTEGKSNVANQTPNCLSSVGQKRNSDDTRIAFEFLDQTFDRNDTLSSGYLSLDRKNAKHEVLVSGNKENPHKNLNLRKAIVNRTEMRHLKDIPRPKTKRSASSTCQPSHRIQQLHDADERLRTWLAKEKGQYLGINSDFKKSQEQAMTNYAKVKAYPYGTLPTNSSQKTNPHLDPSNSLLRGTIDQNSVDPKLPGQNVPRVPLRADRFSTGQSEKKWIPRKPTSRRATIGGYQSTGMGVHGIARQLPVPAGECHSHSKVTDEIKAASSDGPAEPLVTGGGPCENDQKIHSPRGKTLSRERATMMQQETNWSGSSGVSSQDKVKGHQQAMPQMPSANPGRQSEDAIKSYDSFFQELERDFSLPHPYHALRGQGEGQKSWSDFSNQSPYTSTLEHKHESTSSSERGNKSRKGNNDKKPQTRTSLSPHSVCSSLRSDSQYSSCYSSNIRRQESFNSRPKYLDDRSTDQNRNTNHCRTNDNTPAQNSNMGMGIPSSYEPFQSKNSGSFDNNGTISSQTSSNDGRKASEQVKKSLKKQSQNHTHRHSQNNAPNFQIPASHQSTPPRNQTFSSPGDFIDRGERGGKRSQGIVNGHFREMDRNVPEPMLNGLSGEESNMRDGLTDNSHGRVSHPWPESIYSYSDNEKQLLEEMRRMKKEHQNVLRTYEGRVNKLMAKMHELRNIAEMLEHSSNKSSPFGALPAKIALLNILGEGQSEKSPKQGDGNSRDGQVPPPLPPRPGRGSKIYPNKPIISPTVDMKNLPWSRIILDGSSSASIIWQGMEEPEFDRDELERNFSGLDEIPPNLTLYDDICQRRGEVKSEIVSIYDADRSQRINSELRNLNCTVHDITKAFVTLSPGDLYIDSFAELLELMASHRDVDKINHHVKRKGSGQLDAPEYLVFELSKIDHFRERLEFLRFKNKLQINLFEIDQQLRELHIACNEITSSLALKNVLETVLAVGNYMNGGTDKGQADGYKLEIINSLKYIQDKTRKGNLLEFVMKIYCLRFESDLTHGCPTHFRLPEPSNMRHAAQVSFEDIQRALKELKDELSFVMNKLESLSRKQGNLNQTLKVTSENFMTSAVEVLAEEQKLLDDTKVEFRKTVAFFNENEESSTPHSFFQLWASFLHDCKYYWKLAHRNLARAKFTEELATKSQLSCSSLPGFNNLKSVMMKHVASLQKENEMNASKAQQLQHISSWIESVGRYTMEMEPNHNPPQNAIQSAHSKPSSQVPKPRGEQNNSSLHQKLGQEPAAAQYANSAMYLGEKDMYRNRTNLKYSGESELNREKSAHPTNHNHENAAPSSPKPIKAIPPNVIKPLPINHISPTISSPSPSSPNIHMGKPISFVQAQQSTSGIPCTVPEDNFGFTETTPTISWSSPDNQASSHRDHGPGFQQSPDPQGAMSPNGDYLKKNPFFKNLLKKDTKKSPHGAQEDRSPQSSSKGVSLPLNKLKNTFVQKLASSGNSRKSREAKSSRNRDSGGLSPPTNLQVYIPDLPETGFRDDSDYPQSPNGRNENKGGLRNQVDQGKPFSPDYQNFHPSQPRRPEQPQAMSFHPPHSRDDVDSIPSTVSSIKSVNETARYLNRPYGNRDLNALSEDINSDVMSNPSEITTVSSSIKPSYPRLRAAIALGSNISISDVFDKASDSTLMEDQDERLPNQLDPIQSYDNNNNNYNNNPNQNHNRSNHKRSLVAAVPTVSDQKLVKSNAVPVYKAKLIPNYENQTKIDPRMDVGIRGQAEAVHVPQLSIGSESYKQELQKKSEQYVGGGAYHLYGQSQNRGVSGYKIPGAPTSYTVMPPKPSHYHASPIQVSPFGGYHFHDPSPQTQFSSPNNNGKSKKDKDLRKDDQNTPVQFQTKSSSDMSTPIFQSSEGQKDRNNKTPFAGSNTVPIPGRRSASAHNLIDRESANSRNEVKRKPDHFTADSSGHKGSQGHLSRRDLNEMKTTPTSRRVQSQGRHKESPVTVTSLIDKFEKRPHSEQSNAVGLIDINDKPPSMTSTPVSKRKAGNTTPSSSHSGQGKSLTPQSETENLSGHLRQVDNNDHRPRIDGSSSAKSQSKQFDKFESPSQVVSPFSIQGSLSNSEVRTQQNHTPNSRVNNTHASYSEQSPLTHQPNGSRHPDGHERENGQKSYSRLQAISSDSLMPNKRTADQFKPDHSHSSSDRRTGQSSVIDANGLRNRHSTPSSTCSSYQSTSYQSPYIPKPEPQYPSAIKNPNQFRQQSPSTSTTSSSHHSKPTNGNNERNHTQDQLMGNRQSQSHQQGHPQFVELEHYGLNQQENHTNPLGYHSWPSSSSTTMYQSANVLDVENKDDNGNYNQQTWTSYRSSNSAFEHPTKIIQSHTNHKSALAVVKPTVMHL